MNSHAKDIVDVADKYGVVNLKLEAEARLVKATCFSVGNLLDLLEELHALERGGDGLHDQAQGRGHEEDIVR
jgi:hypothetical protein